MMLENNKNLTCEFAEELVSFLYDELSGADKARFEKHLGKCPPCAEELSGFSAARSSVQEWRNEEFLPLIPPIIEIPYPAKTQLVETGRASQSWLASVRAFFTLSPAWMTATTALAALAICVGLFLVVVNYIRDNKNLADLEKVQPVLSPTTGNQNQNSNVSNNNSTKPSSNKSPESPVKENQVPPKVAPVPVKTSTNQNVTKPQNLNVRKPIQPKGNNKTTPNQKAPSLLEEEEEDDTLRLSDLLESVGTRD